MSKADFSRGHEECPVASTSVPAGLLILGLGNPMMADDGAGHEVARRLARYPLPHDVRAVASNEDILALTTLWRGEREVWLVDAVVSGLPPGSLHVYEHRDLLELPADWRSAHQPSVSEGLRWMMHARPEMAVIEFRLHGIEAAVVRPGRGLSRAVEGAVGALVVELRLQVVNRLRRDTVSGSPCRGQSVQSGAEP